MGRVARVVVEGVTKTFGAVVALRGVDVQFEAGTVTLLEGGNGAGKSTLMGIVGGVVRPSLGEVRFQDAGGQPVEAGIAWVAHETLCYPELSVRKNVELAAELAGEDAGAAWAAAEARFQLGSFAERRVRVCSRGQRQRAALARALVGETDIVLLDEPTAGLDKAGVARLQDVVREEGARGAVVLVISHEAAVWDGVATRRVRLERGRIVEGAAA